MCEACTTQRHNRIASLFNKLLLDNDGEGEKRALSYMIQWAYLLKACGVSGNFFEVLGIEPRDTYMGRTHSTYELCHRSLDFDNPRFQKCFYFALTMTK